MTEQPFTPEPRDAATPTQDPRLVGREVTELPSGRLVAMREGKGSDIERASIISGMGDAGRKSKSPMSMMIALAALKGLFSSDGQTWREVTYEELRDEWSDLDVFALIGEAQKPMGKASPSST